MALWFIFMVYVSSGFASFGEIFGVLLIFNVSAWTKFIFINIDHGPLDYTYICQRLWLHNLCAEYFCLRLDFLVFFQKVIITLTSSNGISKAIHWRGGHIFLLFFFIILKRLLARWWNIKIFCWRVHWNSKSIYGLILQKKVAITMPFYGTSCLLKLAGALDWVSLK